MTCSPDQASFVRADHIIEGDGFDYDGGHYEGQTVSMVKDVTYFAHGSFVEAAFESCRNVQFPGMGNVLTFLCGAWGVADCTPFRWFDFMGDTANGYAPFMIHYDYFAGSEDNQISEDGHIYHNPEIIPCNEAAPELSACGCTNCPAACAGVKLPQFDEKEDWFNWDVNSNLVHLAFAVNPDFKIGDHDGLAIIMGAIFAIGSLLFLAFATDLFAWFGAAQTQATISVFTWWGTFAARHPLPVILVSIGLVGGLCTGITMLEVTTDPIELWASPTSRSRVEKDFFDSEFRPFYRTAIVIVKALHNPEVGMDYINIKGITGQPYKFSPMFNPKFLNAVLDLQKSIEGIEAVYQESTTLDLTDVCFKPLEVAPGDLFGGSSANGNCSINSIWAYWQDDAEHLIRTGDCGDNCGGINRTELNYLDHFIDCTKNPSQNKQQDTT